MTFFSCCQPPAHSITLSSTVLRENKDPSNDDQSSDTVTSTLMLLFSGWQQEMSPAFAPQDLPTLSGHNFVAIPNNFEGTHLTLATATRKDHQITFVFKRNAYKDNLTGTVTLEQAQGPHSGNFLRAIYKLSIHGKTVQGSSKITPLTALCRRQNTQSNEPQFALCLNFPIATNRNPRHITLVTHPGFELDL